LYEVVDLLDLDTVNTVLGLNSCSMLPKCDFPRLQSLNVITSIDEVIKIVLIYCSFQI
jgi:hypothetical protein